MRYLCPSKVPTRAPAFGCLFPSGRPWVIVEATPAIMSSDTAISANESKACAYPLLLNDRRSGDATEGHPFCKSEPLPYVHVRRVHLPHLGEAHDLLH